MPYKDPIKKKKAWKRWYLKIKSNPIRNKKLLKGQREKRLRNIERYHDYERRSYYKNREKLLKRGRESTEKARLIALSHYSEGEIMCKCCGESNTVFLTLDHINGKGSLHRKKVGSGRVFYRWLKKNRYPEGFQVLCFNCNYAKYRKGVCPHQIKHES